MQKNKMKCESTKNLNLDKSGEMDKKDPNNVNIGNSRIPKLDRSVHGNRNLLTMSRSTEETQVEYFNRNSEVRKAFGARGSGRDEAMMLRRGSWSEKRTELIKQKESMLNFKSKLADMQKSPREPKPNTNSIPDKSCCEKTVAPNIKSDLLKLSYDNSKPKNVITTDDSKPNTNLIRPEIDESNCEKSNETDVGLSRVDLILNNSLFKKHLSKHGHLLKKHLLSSRRFGLRKTVSNIDISLADYEEVQTNGNFLNVQKVEGFLRLERGTKSETVPENCENDDIEIKNEEVFLPNELTNARRHKHLRRNSISSGDLFAELKDFSVDVSQSSSATRRRKTSIPTFDEFRKQRGHLLSGRLKFPSPNENKENSSLITSLDDSQREETPYLLQPILEDDRIIPEMDRRGSLTEKKFNSLQHLENRRGSNSNEDDSTIDCNDVKSNSELQQSGKNINFGIVNELESIEEEVPRQRKQSRSGSQIAWDLCNNFSETRELSAISEDLKRDCFQKGDNSKPISSEIAAYSLVGELIEEEEYIPNPIRDPPICDPPMITYLPPLYMGVKRRVPRKEPDILVLRSTSDVSEKTSEAQRKKRDRKERPYKSDPFSQSENIHIDGAFSSGEEMVTGPYKENIRCVDGVFRNVVCSSVTSVMSVMSDSPSLQSLDEMPGEFSESDTDSMSESERKSRNRLSNVSIVSSASIVSTDSGVTGNDSSSPESTLKVAATPASQCQDALTNNIYCPDCNPSSIGEITAVEQVALVCSKCLQRRREQKETVQEIVDTEINYGRDLHILKEEFYKPMKATGLLSAEQLEMVFINLDELINVNAQFTELLQCAVSSALQNNDNCLSSVHMGSLFIDSSQMFLAFENYCVGQGVASQTLEQLEREKELLHVFLQVSQRDNEVLRRMHLKSFLMVPVQRIMKYPLLLCRLYKSTPSCHKDKEDIKHAQEKIEDILSHINARTKSCGSFRMKRKRPQQRKYSLTEKIEVNRVAMEVLGWNKKEVTELITSRLMTASTTDHMWAAKKCKNLKFNQIHGTILTLGQARLERRNSDHLMFPRCTQVQQAAVVLVREKNGKYQAVRDPMFLDKCVITVDPEYDEVFELHEWGREPSIFKAEDPNETRMWIQLLRQQTRDLGKWRMRRNAMPNIMIKNMV